MRNYYITLYCILKSSYFSLYRGNNREKLFQGAVSFVFSLCSLYPKGLSYVIFSQNLADHAIYFLLRPSQEQAAQAAKPR